MSRKLFFPHMNIFLEVEEPKLTTSVSLERFIHCNYTWLVEHIRQLCV